MNIKEFRTLVLKNARDKGMKIDKDAVALLTDSFFEVLCTIPDDEGHIFISERKFTIRMRSKGE